MLSTKRSHNQGYPESKNPKKTNFGIEHKKEFQQKTVTTKRRKPRIQKRPKNKIEANERTGEKRDYH